MSREPVLASTVASNCGAGTVEVVVTDLPATGTFNGPEMCPADCSDGPVYQEIFKCVEGQPEFSIGVFVDGAFVAGGTVPDGYGLCSACPEQVEVTTKAPTWEPACFDGCEAGFVCIEDGAATQWLLPSGDVVTEAPEGWSPGACAAVERTTVCVGLAPFDPCTASPYIVVRDPKSSRVFKWYGPDGVTEVADPTEGLTLGADYQISEGDCDYCGCGEPCEPEEPCTPERVTVCVQLAPFDPCTATPFLLVRCMETSVPIRWFGPDGVTEVADPTDGLVLGTDYQIAEGDCCYSGCGDCTRMEPCPLTVPENPQSGSVTYPDVESLHVHACVPEDCESEPESVVVEWVKGDLLGSVTVPCGGSDSFGTAGCCELFDSITVIGVAEVRGTTCVEVPCEEEGN